MLNQCCFKLNLQERELYKIRRLRLLQHPQPQPDIKAFRSGTTDLCARDPIRNIQIMCLGSGVEPKTTGSRIGHLSVS